MSLKEPSLRQSQAWGSRTLLDTCGSWETGGCGSCGRAAPRGPGAADPLVSPAESRTLGCAGARARARGWTAGRIGGGDELCGLRSESSEAPASVRGGPGRRRRGALRAWSCPGTGPSSALRARSPAARPAPPAESRHSINNHKPPAHPPLKINNSVIRVISEAS